MDSDSADLSSPPDDSVSIPSDSVIEKALCDTVVACYKSKDLDSLTLKRVRNTVTEKLNLPEDFLKTDPRWKNKSKEVVNDEVVSRILLRKEKLQQSHNKIPLSLGASRFKVVTAFI